VARKQSADTLTAHQHSPTAQTDPQRDAL
jgi:hypothetical protein